jgi:lipoteichoic acid synthase
MANKGEKYMSVIKKIPKELSIAILFIWVKTYLVYKLVFNLPIDSLFQEFILLINPLSAAFFCFGISYFFSTKNRKKILLLIATLFSILLYVNTLYYRFFSDFITIPVLFQGNNVSDIGNSLWEQIYLYDVFFFLDLIVLYFFYKSKSIELFDITKKQRKRIFITAFSILAINLLLAEIARPQLLIRSFDRELLVKNIGTYNYHLYDLFIQSKTSAQKAFADSVDVEEVNEYLQQKESPTNEEMFGIAKGRNVIFISMESTQNFVVNRTFNGEEITPFINDLVKDEDTFYFDNFYHQVGQGKTSDSEFITENSLYPLPRGAVFQTHPLNEYMASPEILKDEGYYSAVFHGNNKSFWNRDIMYNSLGYDKFFSEEFYNVNENNEINYGLKDIPFFEQSMTYLKDLPQPFYTKFITLTNHHPYKYADEDLYFSTKPEDNMINNYFVTVRYTDEAIKKFFNMLKAEGLYENSMIIIYGDHYGISGWHNAALAEELGKDEITPAENVLLQKVPLIIHIPGVEEHGKTISTIGGQIDVKPTLLNILGVNSDNIHFGTDLFAEDRDELVVFRDLSFVSDKYIFTENKCYENPSGKEVAVKKCGPGEEKATNELEASDNIIYGDLLRFINK